MKYQVKGTKVRRVREFTSPADENWEVKVRYVPNVINEVEGFL